MKIKQSYILFIGLLIYFGLANKAQAFCEAPFEISYSLLDKDDFSTEKLNQLHYVSSSPCKIEGFGAYKGDVIFRITKTDPSFHKDFLVIENPLLDHIELYTQQYSGDFQLNFQTGDLYKFGKRLNQYFLIPLPDEETFYVRITNYGNNLYLPLEFADKKELIYNTSYNDFFNGLLYGILILSALFNTYLWMRKNSSIHYSIYLLALFVLIFTMEGYAYQLVWPNSPYIQRIAVPVCVVIICFSMTRFFQFFYSTQKYLPKFNRFLNYLLAILPAVLAFNFLPSPELDWIKMVISNSMVLFFIGISLPAIIHLYKTLSNELLLITFSLLAFFICVLIDLMASLNFINYTPFIVHITELGTFIQVLLLTLAISFRFKNMRQFKVEQLIKTNRFKQQENLKLMQQIEDRKSEIFEQSTQLEEHNQSILNSISYSYNVQRTLLPEPEKIKPYFNDCFLIYEPKDIVSGDFYWVKKVKIYEDQIQHNFTLIAVGDCTGHGIPGALISVLAINTLNQAVRLVENKNTEDILNFLNAEINSIFNSNVDAEGIRDGLDIALCALNHETKELHYSTANSQILHLRNENIQRLKTSASPIGIHEEKQSFNQDILQLEDGDIIYLLSDGYADQFGGTQGKKYKINALKKSLLEISREGMIIQKSILETRLKNWKGNLEQTDDITVVGIKI